MPNTRQVKRLDDYTPPDYFIDTVRLHFSLHEGHSDVQSLLTLRPAHTTPPRRPLVLHGHALELLSIVLNDTPLSIGSFQLNTQQLTIPAALLPDGTFTLAITTRIRPHENTALEGLYRSSGIFCTQCEAEGFRRITYYLDRPDVLARFTTSIEADKTRYPILLANGNLLEQRDLPGGRHRAIWNDPFPKPCYLFALVAGDLHCQTDQFITMSNRRVELRFYVEHSNQGKCDHAIQSLKKAMRWDEERFGREYDLDLYMVFSANDFNMGAMENKGLNIFNAKYVLADRQSATDNDYYAIESVIAHEYFHNWTGNRITCRDWFQLSLKEGLTVFRDQLFSGETNSLAVQRIEDVRILRSAQFPEDAGPTAHPVQPNAYIEINNFYTATVYDKGAEVVRMIHTLLGDAGFRQGMDLYFQRHDGQAVTVEEFVRAMEEANHRDLQQFRRWYRQAGTPRVQATWSHDTASQTLELTLRQSCPATPDQPNKEPFHLPFTIGLLDRTGTPLPVQLAGEAPPPAATSRTLELRQAEESFRFINLPEPPIPSLLRNFSAPVRLEAGFSDSELAFLWARDTDPFNRWEAGQELGFRVIRQGVEHRLAGEPFTLDPTFAQAFIQSLQAERADPALTALALTLPAASYVLERLAPMDPLAIHETRQSLVKQLARRFKAELTAAYQANRLADPYVYDPRLSGQRSLKNLCLDYLLALDEPEYHALALAQFQQADNMTDQLRALTALAHGNSPEREGALEQFFQQWRHNPLIMDKWLQIQATIPQPETLERVQELLNHPTFSLRNPNKVRSLIGAFCMGNLPGFHQASGLGYQFLATQILAIDPANPQLAARLTTPLTRWRSLDTSRQVQIQHELTRILAQGATLSTDLYEVASKSMG